MTIPIETDFDDWLTRTYARVGSFTMLIVLVRIAEPAVELLRSTHLHVVGDETRWPEMAALFAGAGVSWNAAVFFQAGREGLVEDAVAKQRLASLVRHMNEDRTVIKDGEFFDAAGLRLQLEEVPTH